MLCFIFWKSKCLCPVPKISLSWQYMHYSVFGTKTDFLFFYFQHCRWIFTSKEGKADPSLSKMGRSPLETLPCLTQHFFIVKMNTASSRTVHDRKSGAAAPRHFPGSLQFPCAGADRFRPCVLTFLTFCIVLWCISESRSFPNVPRSDKNLNFKHRYKK